ncbi:hypothetical protein QRO24_06505 [Gallibacterium anatis]|uniref:hypothetical protein n=1 Tax=Gallibacterium anatis TaxID=750 RepID=UPI0038D46F41
MIKRSYWLALLLLSGCVSQPMMQQKVTVPNKIEFEQQHYQLSKTDDLGSVVKYTYELMNKDQQKHLEIFQDLQQNFVKTDAKYQQRIQLRERMFRNTGVDIYNNKLEQGKLYSYVVYPPAEQFIDYQVDVAKGENLAKCGFVQFQYTQQFSPIKSSQTAILKKLQQQVAEPMMQKLTNFAFPWSCDER